MDTFDLKPGHENGGPYKEIATSVPGIKISEHLPKSPSYANDLAIVRSMSTKEADHGRATYQMRTGHIPGGPVQYPTLGSLFSQGTGAARRRAAQFRQHRALLASSAPPRTAPASSVRATLRWSSARISRASSPSLAGRATTKTASRCRISTCPPASAPSAPRPALQLAGEMQEDFLAERSALALAEPSQAYQRAVTLMRSPRHQGVRPRRGAEEAARPPTAATCSARAACWRARLVERGVPFVEVSLATVANLALGWDTHHQQLRRACRGSARCSIRLVDAAWKISSTAACWKRH